MVSGMQPTGFLHLGNLEGALRNWVRFQNEYETFVFVADWHALTTLYHKPCEIASYTVAMVADFIAAGLEPEKAVIFRQSDVKEHAELHLLLSMVTPVPWLERVPTYKEKQEGLGHESPSYGLLGYPVLQAADILAYRADVVPVGQDQLPHLELTREIARRFNSLYRQVFPEPQALLTEAPVVPGIDGRKMSKSYGNTILISDPPDVIKSKVMMMFTDPAKIRKTDPGHPEICPVYHLHRLYDREAASVAECRCRAGELGCVQHKRDLADAIIRVMEPIRQRRQEFAPNPEEAARRAEEILHAGAHRARAVASETMELVRSAMSWGKPCPE